MQASGAAWKVRASRLQQGVGSTWRHWAGQFQTCVQGADCRGHGAQGTGHRALRGAHARRIPNLCLTLACPPPLLNLQEGHLDFTGAQMVLTLRLIAVAVRWVDGPRRCHPSTPDCLLRACCCCCLYLHIMCPYIVPSPFPVHPCHLPCHLPCAATRTAARRRSSWGTTPPASACRRCPPRCTSSPTSLPRATCWRGPSSRLPTILITSRDRQAWGLLLGRGVL